jgi:anti-anti-sigma factor
MAFDIALVRSRDATILSCRGTLVMERGASALREAGERALSAGKSLALDLAFVTQMDARAIGVLAELYGAARNAGRRVVLVGASDRVTRLLRLTRLDRFIHELTLRAECQSSPMSLGTIL